MQRFPLARAATLLLVLAAGPASAADLLYDSGGSYSEPALNFNGIYAGVQAGGDFGATDAANRITSNGSAYTAAGPRSDSVHESSGGTVGAHVGADFNLGPVVLGAVTDYSTVNAGTRSTTNFGDNSVTVTRKLDSLGTTRARAGLASDRLLVYGTAGIAYGRVKTTTEISDPANIVADDGSGHSDTVVGGVYGGGVDYMVRNDLSVGAEYTYTNLGDSNFGKRFNEAGGGSFDVGESGEDIKLHRLQGKLSYHFN